LVIFIPLVITWGDVEFGFWLSSAHLLSSILTIYDDGPESEVKKIRQKSDLFQGLRLKPAQLVLASFLLVIFLGAFLLLLPVSQKEGVNLSLIDGLFMSTSATCVTGLSTLSLEKNFSSFGQVVILILIQIGGLSIMTLYSSMAILLGRSMGVKDRVIMQDLLDISSLEDLLVMVGNIVKYTFFIELWGAIVLTLAFSYEGFEFGKALYFGIFHSISAFCNAGFSLFDSSLESYAVTPIIHGTISILVILGGLGFIVLKEMTDFVVQRKSLVRLSLHTKVVLIMTVGLIICGMLFIFFSEFLNSLDSYTLWEKIQISLFQSITLRTAGFNTIPLTSFNSFTIYGMALFMFIGASPGSTGGGVKTTTLAILIAGIRSTLLGRKKVGMFDRIIPSPMVVRATALLFISMIITSAFMLILMAVEPDTHYLPIFFEVVSASATVGLSLGVTSALSFAGKCLISILMLIGRIGPLTLILAVAQREKLPGAFEYPDGKIMLG
jgi:trk system potassium uptake protein TrkH